MAALLIIAVGYATLDFALGILLGRCVMPGLKCHACKQAEKERRA